LLCEGLGFKVGSVRGDRGLSTVEFKGAAGLEGTTKMYYLGVRANSILREHIGGRGWVENEETGERACVRRNLDYHGVNLARRHAVSALILRMAPIRLVRLMIPRSSEPS
jgi:hypothetical protein